MKSCVLNLFKVLIHKQACVHNPIYVLIDKWSGSIKVPTRRLRTRHDSLQYYKL